MTGVPEQIGQISIPPLELDLNTKLALDLALVRGCDSNTRDKLYGLISLELTNAFKRGMLVGIDYATKQVREATQL